MGLKLFYVFLFLILQPSLSQASPAELFHDRFEVIKNSKNETIIVDKKLFDDVTVTNYINFLRDFFDNKNFNPIDGYNWNCAGAKYDSMDPQVFKYIKKTLGMMSKYNFDGIINDKGFQAFLKKFEAETNKMLNREEVFTLSNLDNSTYFYKVNVKKFFAKQFKGLIKDLVTIPGGVKLALFFASNYENFVLQKREYSQNILISYLLSIPPEELGLTALQSRYALSSIYESRIKINYFYFNAKRESKKAQANWETYGQNKIALLKKEAQKMWDKNNNLFESELVRIEPSFSVSKFNGQPLYINLGHQKGKVSSRPSMTLDESCPDYNYIKRYGLEVIGIGMDVLGVPYSGFIKKVYEEEYKKQIPSEGLLWGQMELKGSVLNAIILKQSLNPFIKVD